MPNHKSAKKRMRQAETRRDRNRSVVSKVKTLIKNVLTATEKAQAEALVSTAYSEIDKLAKRGIIHKSNAANKKSRLALHVNQLGA
jgi:small subunit ribosomal protein S20